MPFSPTTSSGTPSHGRIDAKRICSNDYRKRPLTAPVGVLVRFEAKPDMVDELETLLTALAGQVQREESTIAWFGFREGPTTFGVFHAFSDEAGRETHIQRPARRSEPKHRNCSVSLRQSTTSTSFRRSCPHDSCQALAVRINPEQHRPTCASAVTGCPGMSSTRSTCRSERRRIQTGESFGRVVMCDEGELGCRTSRRLLGRIVGGGLVGGGLGGGVRVVGRLVR